jgi:hypothetical protein
LLLSPDSGKQAVFEIYEPEPIFASLSISASLFITATLSVTATL